MTDDKKQHLRQLLAAGTARPWEHGTATCCPDCGWIDHAYDFAKTHQGGKITHAMNAEDAELVCAAVNALADLLDENERLERQVRAMDTEHRAWHKMADKVIALEAKLAALREVMGDWDYWDKLTSGAKDDS